MDKSTSPWAHLMSEGDFIWTAPTYEVGKYFNDFHEDQYVGNGDPAFNTMKYYYYDPTEHGYPKKDSNSDMKWDSIV